MLYYKNINKQEKNQNNRRKKIMNIFINSEEVIENEFLNQQEEVFSM